jgi:DNA-binding SARP family transcriptional activator
MRLLTLGQLKLTESDLTSKKQLYLMTYLAIETEDEFSRRGLAELLWFKDNHKKSLENLTVNLRAINKKVQIGLKKYNKKVSCNYSVRLGKTG